MLMTQYYKNGCISAEFCGQSLEKLRITLLLLHAGEIKDGFRWEQKYPNTLDLAYLKDRKTIKMNVRVERDAITNAVTSIGDFVSDIEWVNPFSIHNFNDS